MSINPTPKPPMPEPPPPQPQPGLPPGEPPLPRPGEPMPRPGRGRFDLRFSGPAPGQPQDAHRCLGARVDHAHHVDARHRLDDQFGEVSLNGPNARLCQCVIEVDFLGCERLDFHHTIRAGSLYDTHRGSGTDRQTGEARPYNPASSRISPPEYLLVPAKYYFRPRI